MSHLFFVFAGISFIIFLILAHPSSVQGTPLAESIKKTYTPNATYLTPSHADLEKAKQLFYDLFSSSNVQTDEKAWDSLGFSVEKTGSFIVIKEKKSDQNGKGVYVFNIAKPSQVIIEAPHQPSDLHTGTIAIHLIEEGHFLAAGLNTVHRKKANFTREEMTYFNAFTEAFGEAYPQGNIVQLHGFDEERYAPHTDLIFSSTVLSPSPLFYQYGNCLKNLPINISFFPEDIQTLGGTKNVNSLNFYQTGSTGLFFHLEMGMNLRKKLKNNKSFRKIFFGCFEKA